MYRTLCHTTKKAEPAAKPKPLAVPIVPPAAPVAVTAPAPNPDLSDYVVKDPHETLATIAVHSQTTPEILLKLNKISGGLRVGQIVKIPKPKPGAPKAPAQNPEISDAGNIATAAAKNYEQKPAGTSKVADLGEKLLVENKSLKGAIVTAKGLLEEDKSKAKDKVDVELDALRKSRTLKCEAYYMTMMGEIRGHVIVSPYFLTFEAELHAENEKLIPDAGCVGKFQCYVDVGDVTDCSMIVLPSIMAFEDEAMEYFDDYYIDVGLSSVEGKMYTAPATETKAQVKETMAIVHFKLIFAGTQTVPNDLRKRIAAIFVEKLQSCTGGTKDRKQALSSTYVPFFDRLIDSPAKKKGGATKADQNLKHLQASKLKLSGARKSEILTEEMLIQLGAKVSPLMRLREWEVIFGINSDGVSLLTFYNNVKKFNPTIILIKDTHGKIFGGFASEQWRSGKHFYGTGESFLFTFKTPGDLKVFRWTASSDLIMFSDNEKIVLGGGKNYGLEIEESFSQGRTDKCEAFENETLASADEFKIANFEVIGLSYIQ